MRNFEIAFTTIFPKGAGKFNIQNLWEDKGDSYEEVSYGAIVQLVAGVKRAGISSTHVDL